MAGKLLQPSAGRRLYQAMQKHRLKYDPPLSYPSDLTREGTDRPEQAPRPEKKDNRHRRLNDYVALDAVQFALKKNIRSIKT